MTDTSKKNTPPEGLPDADAQGLTRSPAHSTIYDGFRLMRTLGEGFLGTVYAAQNLDAAQVVALRVLTPDLVAQPQAMLQFRRLFEQWRRLAHQNVLPVGELVERERRAHYTMTLAQSGSARHYLQQHAREGQFVDLLIAVDLARQAAAALAYAHDNNLMHGDLKPENLLLQPARAILGRQAYRVQLSDFGVGELQAYTYGVHDRLIVTTPAYMSPEQCRGVRTEVRSDLYALGVVLYELLTNLVPFETRDLADAIEKHQHVAPIPPGQIRVDIPQDLEEIVLTCLAKAPDYRYASARELESALQGVLSRLMPQGPSPTVVLPDIPEPPIPPIEALRDRTTFPRLQICAADGRLLRVEPLREGTTTLGRAPGNTVVLEHAGVSRHHLNIEQAEGGQVMVADLDTVNGTSLNGVPLEPRARVPWPAGGVLRVEPFWIRLQPPQRVVQQSRIGVLVEDNDIVLKPGEARLLKVQLANTGRTVDHFRLEVDGIPPEWVQNLFHEVQLNPGMTAETTLKVLVPRQHQYHAGVYPMQVVARSRENPQEFGYVPMNWTVTQYLDTAVEVTPRRRSAWRRTHYTFRLRNDSNVPIVYNPTVKDDEGGVHLMTPWSQVQIPASGNLQNLIPWRTIIYNYVMRLREGVGKVRVAPFEKDIALEPGQSYEHRMDVRLPIRWIGSPRPRHLHVVAENDHGASVPANVNLLHLPILPLWALPILALLLIGIVWWLLQAPSIVTASVTPQNPLVGKPFTINMETRNTVSVLIKPWNKRVGGGVKRLIIPGGITAPTDVQVIAYGRVKTAQTLFTITPQLPAPVVKSFSVDPQNITAGQTATIRWDVANVKQVTIDPLGTQPARGSITQKITDSTTFTLRADSGGQTVQKSASVKLLSPGIDLFEVTPAQAAPGQTVTIRWRARNASNVTLQPLGTVASEGQTTQKVTGDTTYTLTATVGSQNVVQTASVKLLAPVVESFTVRPENARVGDPVTLSWLVKNASSVTIDPIGTVPAQGTRQLTAQQGVIYKLTASNGQTQQAASAAPTVTAVPPRITGFKASPRKPRTGEPVTISWQTQDASSVTLDGLNGSQVLPQSGSITVTAPAQSANLTLTARNADGAQDAQSVSLPVLPPAPTAPAEATSVPLVAAPAPATPTVTPAPAPVPVPVPVPVAARVVGFYASPIQAGPGQLVTLHWNVQGAQQVKIFPDGQLRSPQGTASVTVQHDTVFTLQAVGSPQVHATAQVAYLTPAPAPAPKPTPTPAPAAPLPKVLGFNASPGQVGPGQTVTLRWNVQGARQVKIFPGGRVYPAQGSLNVPVRQDTVFTLQTVGASPLRARARVDYVAPRVSTLPPALPPKPAPAPAPAPEPAPAPAPDPAPAPRPATPPSIGSFASSAASVTRGDQVTLNWDVQNASRVSLSGIGSVQPQGSLTRRVNHDTDYVLTAIGGGQRVQQTVHVSVAATSDSIGGEQLSGVWLHPFGRLKLSVQGDKVTGSFQNDRTGDQGRLRGQLARTSSSRGGYSLSATVTVPDKPDESISFVVAFNDALNGFYGPYSTRGASERWCGWREGAQPPPQCQ